MVRVGNKPVVSNPPGDKKRIKNIYWDPDSQEIVVEHD